MPDVCAAIKAPLVLLNENVTYAAGPVLLSIYLLSCSYPLPSPNPY